MSEFTIFPPEQLGSGSEAPVTDDGDSEFESVDDDNDPEFIEGELDTDALEELNDAFFDAEEEYIEANEDDFDDDDDDEEDNDDEDEEDIEIEEETDDTGRSIPDSLPLIADFGSCRARRRSRRRNTDGS